MNRSVLKQKVPEDDAVSHAGEQVVAGRIHGQNMFTVAVLLQSFIDPVHKGHLLLLCRGKTAHIRPQPTSVRPVTVQSIILQPFIDRTAEECDGKQGKRGGVTRSRGTRAESPTRVRCRASAHGSHATNRAKRRPLRASVDPLRCSVPRTSEGIKPTELNLIVTVLIIITTCTVASQTDPQILTKLKLLMLVITTDDSMLMD